MSSSGCSRGQRLELADELVELGVGDLGFVVAVVALAVVPDLRRELGRARAATSGGTSLRMRGPSPAIYRPGVTAMRPGYVVAAARSSAVPSWAAPSWAAAPSSAAWSAAAPSWAARSCGGAVVVVGAWSTWSSSWSWCSTTSWWSSWACRRRRRREQRAPGPRRRGSPRARSSAAMSQRIPDDIPSSSSSSGGTSPLPPPTAASCAAPPAARPPAAPAPAAAAGMRHRLLAGRRRAPSPVPFARAVDRGTAVAAHGRARVRAADRTLRSSGTRWSPRQAPSVSRAATAWSCTRAANSRCDAEHPLGLRGTVTREAARRGDHPARAQRHRIAAAPRELAPHRRAARRQCGSADSPTGRSVGTAPHAIQPSPSRKRARRDRVAARGRRSPRPRAPAGPASSAEREIAVAAHVHAGHAVDRGERARQHVDRGLAIERRVVASPRHQRGLVEEQHEPVSGKRASTSSSIATDHARATAAARRNARGAGMPAAWSAAPSVSGPVTCALTRTGGSLGARRDVEEREQARVRPVVEDALRRARRSSPSTVSEPSGATSTSGSAPSHCASIPSRGSRPGAAARPAARGGTAARARPRCRDRCAEGSRCRSRPRAPAPGPGGSASWARTLRSPRRLLQAGRAFSRNDYRTERTESRCLALSPCGCCASRGSRCR